MSAASRLVSRLRSVGAQLAEAARAADGWRVDALLDWEFSYSGSPYADAANMARFSADYPPAFMAGLTADLAAWGRPLAELAMPATAVTRGSVAAAFIA